MRDTLIVDDTIALRGFQAARGESGRVEVIANKQLKSLDNLLGASKLSQATVKQNELLNPPKGAAGLLSLCDLQPKNFYSFFNTEVKVVHIEIYPKGKTESILEAMIRVGYQVPQNSGAPYILSPTKTDCQAVRGISDKLPLCKRVCEVEIENINVPNLPSVDPTKSNVEFIKHSKIQVVFRRLSIRSTSLRRFSGLLPSLRVSLDILISDQPFE